MPNRSSKRFHNQHYRWLARTDGEYCLICRGEGLTRAPPEHPLEIDHARTDLVESDEAYWEPADTALLCSTCNLSLRRKSVEEHRSIIRFYRARNVCERGKEREHGFVKMGPPVEQQTVMDIVDFMHGSIEMQAKSHYEPKFAMFVWERLNEFGSYNEEDLLDSFSYRSRASQVTLKRYLKGYCSTDGPCQRKKVDGEWVVAWKFSVKKSDLRRISLKQKEAGR